MRLPLLLLVLTALPAAWQLAAAQPSLADAYHTAAQLYIDGDAAQAEAVATEALAQAPNPNTPVHPKLNALLELIRQQQQDPQQGEDGEEAEQEGGQDGENQDAQNQQGRGEESEAAPSDLNSEEQEPSQNAEPQPGDEGEPDDQQQPEPPEFEDENNEAESDATSQQPDEPQDEPEQDAQGQSGDLQDGEAQDGEAQDGDATPQGTAEVLPGTMSEAEALRILGALEADEEELLQAVQQRRAPPRRVEKDW